MGRTCGSPDHIWTPIVNGAKPIGWPQGSATQRDKKMPHFPSFHAGRMSPNDISTTDSATEVRDLRTGEQVWRAYRSSAPSAERLRSGLSVDVAILGAGISGALLAEAATARGLSTVVLDRRPPGHGSTAASTALLQFEIDTPLIHLAASIGLERAARIWQRSYRSVQDLARLVRSLDIACDWQNRNAVYLAGNVLDPGRLAEEFVMRQSIGLPTILLGRADLHGLAGIDREAALYSQGAAEVNPVQLTDGLLTIAQRRGCRLLAPVQIADVQPSSGGVMLASDDGMEIAARALVFATGYELAHGVPTEGHKRTSTWAFATKAQPGAVWPNRELIWEAADPYLYIRTTLDGRVIVGGEDEDIDDETLRDALLPVKIEALQAKAKALLPALDVAADFRWTGTFGESEGGLPSIGAIPDMPGCYGVLGYGGNGITFAMIASQILAAELCGDRDPDAELFAFGRPA